MDGSGQEDAHLIANTTKTQEISQNTDGSSDVDSQTTSVSDWLRGSALRLLELQVLSGEVYLLRALYFFKSNSISLHSPLQPHSFFSLKVKGTIKYQTVVDGQVIILQEGRIDTVTRACHEH